MKNYYVYVLCSKRRKLRLIEESNSEWNDLYEDICK